MARKASAKNKKIEAAGGSAKDQALNKRIVDRLKVIRSVTSKLRKDSLVSEERRRIPFTV